MTRRPLRTIDIKVIELISKGMTDAEIASCLSIDARVNVTVHRVSDVRQRIRRELGAANGADIVRLAIRACIVDSNGNAINWNERMEREKICIIANELIGKVGMVKTITNGTRNVRIGTIMAITTGGLVIDAPDARMQVPYDRIHSIESYVS